jgi:hypothetical protein
MTKQILIPGSTLTPTLSDDELEKLAQTPKLDGFVASQQTALDYLEGTNSIQVGLIEFYEAAISFLNRDNEQDYRGVVSTPHYEADHVRIPDLLTKGWKDHFNHGTIEYALGEDIYKVLQLGAKEGGMIIDRNADNVCIGAYGVFRFELFPPPRKTYLVVTQLFDTPKDYLPEAAFVEGNFERYIRDRRGNLSGFGSIRLMEFGNHARQIKRDFYVP